MTLNDACNRDVFTALVAITEYRTSLSTAHRARQLHTSRGGDCESLNGLIDLAMVVEHHTFLRVAVFAFAFICYCLW